MKISFIIHPSYQLSFFRLLSRVSDSLVTLWFQRSCVILMERRGTKDHNLNFAYV